jgi:predicted Fe-Mo cluster-binding NifX family protein
MKICIPVLEDTGLKSATCSHFGSARTFLVCDPETMVLERIDNRDAEHEHGMCNPVAAISSVKVDAVVAGGIGPRAVQALNGSGIRVFRSVPGSVSDNIEAFRQGRLTEISSEGACSEGHGHGCG